MELFYSLSLSTICFLILGFVEINALKKCKVEDQACKDSSANEIYQQIIKGIPDLHIEPLDPTHHDIIEGNLSILKYTFSDSTFSGFSSCKIANLNYNLETLKLHTKFVCGAIDMKGRYETSGRLIVLPVEGKGDYKINTGGYELDIDCDLNINEGSDGRKHLHIKNYKIKATATRPIVYEFKNLFNGQKDLSDDIHKFANENWKEVADFVQDPVWYAELKKMVSNVNTYLKSVPLEELKS